MKEFVKLTSKRRGYKYWFGALSAVLAYLFWRFLIIPLVYYLFIGLEDSSVLRDAIAPIIPADLSIQDIITDDALITAWDFNNRSPRFYSKWYQKNEDKTIFNHNMSFLDMVWTSANTQYYFMPAVVDGDVYMSGSNYAKSPALYAYLYATERLGVKQADINMVSVGSTNEEPELIGDNVGLLDWVSRLTSLASSVKVHTMNYMLEYILREN